jgi:uncharacterized protein YjiS (DUF1127 family)
MQYEYFPTHTWPDSYSVSRSAYKVMNFPTRVFETVGLWRARSRQRQILAGFTASQMNDIGVSPVDIRMEVNKPFWKA